MSGSSAASGAGSGRFAGHEGVHAGVDTSYQPMRDQHHDTHAEAMAARAEHPSVKRRGIEPMTDLLSPGQRVLFPLNDGLHRGAVIADVCTLGELYEGNLHVRVSGAKGGRFLQRSKAWAIVPAPACRIAEPEAAIIVMLPAPCFAPPPCSCSI